MKWNCLLFTICTCLCVDATAQVASTESSDGTASKARFGIGFNNGGSGVSKSFKRMINPVRTTKGFDNVMRAAEPMTKVTSPWNARMAATRAAGDATMKLDSIIGYNADGSKYTLQAFKYNTQGLTVSQKNSYYNPETGQWNLAEEYGYEWTDDGLVLDEWSKAYGMGTRRTYVYNDRGWGIEQIIYDLDMNGEWKYLEKGEYEYDDNANITGERTYTWDGTQWQPMTKATSRYDEKNRQIYIESYYWDGAQWVGSDKHEYEWCEKPDPQPVDPTSTDRFTYSMAYLWDNGTWTPQLMYVQEFDTPDGYITLQKTCWWNGRNWGGENGSTTVATWTYDEHNAIIDNDGYWCVNDSAAWIKSYDGIYNWTYDEEGNREGGYDIIFMNYDSEYNPTDQYISTRYEEGYNADNLVTWRKVWGYDYMTGDIAEQEEMKRRYDDKGNITYEGRWTWSDGERQPESELTCTYDEDGNIIEESSRTGGSFGGIIISKAPATRGSEIDDSDLEGWTNNFHSTYSYEDGTCYERLTYKWNNDKWTTNNGQIVDYDFDRPAESVITPAGWIDPYKIDAVHDLIGDGDEGWTSADKLYYWTEETATGITETSAAAELKARLIGNVLNVTAGDGLTVNLYNASGACVASTKSGAIDMTGMPAGLYIVKAGAAATKIIKK